MKKVAIYIRVSTQEQAKEGYSIPAQKDKLIAFSKAKNWRIFDTYIDDGYTGTNLDRPALKSLLENLKSIDIVLVYKLDRLSRSQKDVLYLVEEKFLENDVDFVSILESFDTTTPFGRAMLGILAAFAQLERDTIIQRSKLGKERRAKEGKWRGGPVPLGYDYINGKLAINEYEASIIRRIFEKYISGSGMDNISKELNSKGYRSKQNAKFTSSKIKTYLSNSIYAGMIPYKDTVFTGDHKSIIDLDTFNLVQSLMKDRSYSFHKTSGSLLGGLMICGECGAKLFRRKVRNYYYYTCYTYHGSPSHMVTDKGCNLGYINSASIENEIISKLCYFDDDKYILHSLAKGLLALNETNASEALIHNLKKELSKATNELSRWYTAYGKGDMDYNEVNERIKLASMKKKNIEDQISSILQSNNETQTNHIKIEELEQIIQDFNSIWKNATHQERKIILKGFIRSIIVFKDKPPLIKFNI